MMSNNKSKREGLTDQQLKQRRREKSEGRTRSANDVRPKGSKQFMGQRESLRHSGQVRSSDVSPELAAFRRVSESRHTVHPTMGPPITHRSSKPQFRKAIKKRALKLAAQQMEATNNA